MSYDIWIERPDGTSAEPAFNDILPGLSSDGMAGTVEVTASGNIRIGNYTSNVSGMWTRCLSAVRDGWALAWPTGIKRPPLAATVRLADLHGLRSGDVADLLRRAVEWGTTNLDDLRADNPPNGWGNAEGAVTYLWDIQRLCEQNDGIVRISR